MSKNIDFLRQISDYFTEDTLKNIVAKEKNADKSNIEILSWDFETISGKGDNYLSVVNKMNVKSKISNATFETKLIIKSFPKNSFIRNLLRSTEYFENEITFYTKVATEFHSYLTTKQQNQLLSIPQCWAHHCDNENDFLVLEDVTVKGYSSIARHSLLTYEDCKLFIETLARFHGISFAYKNERKDEFNKISSTLIETFYRNDIYESPFYKHLFDSLFKVAKDALAKEYPRSKGEKVFNSYDPEELFKKTVEICSKKNGETSVISQGDSWAPNFMVRKNASGETNVLMLDFQMVRCASPVLDVVFFIYQCTDKSVRDQYYERLLQDYYAELEKTIKVLGSDPEKLYSKQVFQDEVKQQSLYGLMFALVNIPLVLMPENEVPDFEAIPEEELNIADLATVPLLDKAEDRQRLANVILHAVEKGFI